MVLLCPAMFEDFTFSVRIHRSRPSTYDVSPHNTSPSSPPSPISSLEVILKVESTDEDLASQLDGSKPQEDEISSSYLCNSSSQFDTLADESFLTVDPEYENDSRSEPSLPPSLPTQRPCRRHQRLPNSQLLCTNSQTEAIGEMAEETSPLESQSDIKTPAASLELAASPAQISQLEDLEPDRNSIQPSGEIDEGYFEAEEEDADDIEADALLATIRQAAASAAIRRQNGYGKGAVYTLPRMRRKILKRRRREQQDILT